MPARNLSQGLSAGLLLQNRYDLGAAGPSFLFLSCQAGEICSPLLYLQLTNLEQFKVCYTL